MREVWVNIIICRAHAMMKTGVLQALFMEEVLRDI